MTLLSVNNLSISTSGTPLVRDISFDINKAEIMAIVGESGSGKTLTALSIMGLLPNGLSVRSDMTFEGVRLRGQQAEQETLIKKLRGKHIGMIFQEPMTSLNPLHTIGRQIGEAVSIHQRRLSKAQIRTHTRSLLDKVGLEQFRDRLDAYPHQLSGGERQRVMIAMAIANDPALLIADEPTTALDVTIQAQILALIEELRGRLGMAVLLITHDLPLVKRIADRVVIMSQGEIVEGGKTADIFNAPQHAYTKMLLAAAPGEAPATPAAQAPIISCNDLCVSYAAVQKRFTFKKERRIVLSDITLSVPQGQTLGVVGESGSGKTTLAFALLRLVASKGSIVFGGEAIDTLSGNAMRSRRRDMQVVFQDPFSSLNPRMAIGEIISEGLDIHFPKLNRYERETQLDAVMRETGLPPESKGRYPHEFSGGQRQRISIARALILKPKLLILDEPTSALDMSVQAQILELLLGLQRKHGLTYIFISHDLRVVRALSHRIMVLQHGKIVEEGDARQIFAAPKEDYTKALIKAAML